MAYDYDKLYREQPNALGLPNAKFAAVFNSYEKANARVLDIGCGQGRDALPIAARGHAVTGVDISKAGVADMVANASKAGVSITGIVADLNSFTPSGTFDVIVIDRTLHMLAATDRNRLLALLVDHIAPGGYLLLADEKSNMPAFKSVLQQASSNWAIEQDYGAIFFTRHTKNKP